MKKKVYSFLLAALTAVLASSCSSNDPDLIWDIVPLVISVKVVSPDGYSVLNAVNTPQITATYKGKTYACRRRTRLCLPHFFGLVYSNDYLLFGELDGTGSYTDEQLAINWGDGSPEDVITFSHQVEWKKDKPHFKQSFYLNGKRVEGQITIQKDLKAPGSDTPRVTIPLTDAQLAHLYAVNRMGFNLFQLMLNEPKADGHSIVISPLNVAFTLGMLADGAATASETCQQLLRVLNGLNGTDKVNIERTDHDELFKQFIDFAPIVDGQVNVTFANALVARKEKLLYAGYSQFLADYYQADYLLLDFASASALDEINAWCRQKTQGLIPHITNEIDPSSAALWLNAFCFKGGWAKPFDKASSNIAAFTRPDGSRADLKMMHSISRNPFVNLSVADVVALPFNNGAYEMDVLLPHEGRTFKDVIAAISIDQPTYWTWQVADMHLSMPAFQVESFHDNLHQPLQQMGITRLFAPDAQLTEVSPDAGLFISMMKQAARITIDEDGCEGGAVAGEASEETTEPAITFNANRPFLYLIRETSSGAILLIGTYCGEQRIDDGGLEG